MKEESVSLEGPVEKLDGKLDLVIPLEAGGNQLIACSRGISEVKGENLVVIIPEWLSGMLRIEEGDIVAIDNLDGKFNIHPISPRPVQ